MRATLIQFSRFAGAGVFALVVDTVVLCAALAAGCGYYLGRVLSFSAAVYASWQVNRRFTFANGTQGSAWVQFWRYLAVMLAGGAVNYGTYSLVVTFAPPHPLLPMLAVAAGSIAGMPFNFASAKLLVFRA